MTPTGCLRRCNKAVDLVVAGELTTQAIADQLRTTRQTLGEWCQKPAFQAEYPKRPRTVEQQA